MNMSHLRFVMEQRGGSVLNQTKVVEPPPVNAQRPKPTNNPRQVVVTWEGGTERQVLEVDESKG